MKVLLILSALVIIGCEQSRREEYPYTIDDCASNRWRSAHQPVHDSLGCINFTSSRDEEVQTCHCFTIIKQK
jgi:hypothetical protein